MEGEFGTRVTDVWPHCGKTSLKNPSYVWYAGYTEIIGGIRASEYKCDVYNWVRNVEISMINN